MNSGPVLFLLSPILSFLFGELVWSRLAKCGKILPDSCVSTCRVLIQPHFFHFRRADPDSGTWTSAPNCFSLETDEAKVSEELRDAAAEATADSLFAFRCCGHEKLRQWLLFDCHCQTSSMPLLKVLVNGRPARDVSGRLLEKTREDLARYSSNNGRRDVLSSIYSPSPIEAGFLVSQGDVVEFLVDSHPRSCFRFSLSVLDDEEEEEVDQAPAGTEPRSEVSQTPVPKLLEDILRRISNLLPVKDVVESLPFVSREFLEIAATRKFWPSLEFSTEFEEYYDDYVLVCKNGAESCQSLVIEHVPSEETPSSSSAHAVSNRLLRCIFSRPWPNLRRLHFCREFDEDVYVGTGESLEAVFPAVKDLFLVERLRDPAVFRRPHSVTRGRALWPFRAPAVETLTVRIDNDPDQPTCDREGVLLPGSRHFDLRVAAGCHDEELHSQFPNLERLCLICGTGLLGANGLLALGDSYVLSALRCSSSLNGPPHEAGPGPRPPLFCQLRELKLALFHENLASEVIGFRLPSLEVLVLELRPGFRFRGNTLDVPRLLSRHPRLRRLYLGGVTDVLWGGGSSLSGDLGRLGQLECLGVGALTASTTQRRNRTGSGSAGADLANSNCWNQLADVVSSVEKVVLPATFNSCIRDEVAWFWKDGTALPWEMKLTVMSKAFPEQCSRCDVRAHL